MKRFLLAAAATLLWMPTAGAAFTDIANHPYENAIIYVQEQGIVEGYKDGSFKPNQPINRAEFLKIVAEAFDDQTTLEACAANASVSLKDIAKTDWYARYVCAAMNHGKRNPVGGYPDGTFRPAQNISFVEAAKILVGYQEARMWEEREKVGDRSLFNPFVVGIPNDAIWYEKYIQYLDSESAIPLSILKLEQPLTRGEMAQIIFVLKEQLTGYPSQTLQALRNGMPLLENEVALITRYYYYIDLQALDAAFAMRSDQKDFKGFQQWYEKLMRLEVLHLNRDPSGAYSFLILIVNTDGTRELFDVRMRVTAEGKLDTVSSARVDNVILKAEMVEGTLTPAVVFEHGDLVLYLYAGETGFEIDRVKQNPDTIFNELYAPSFSGDGRYLMYSIGFSEGRVDRVFDIETKKIVHMGEAEYEKGFTRDGTGYYACTENGLFVGNVHFYAVPGFTEIPADYDGTVSRCGTYDALKNTYTFTIEGTEPPKEMTFNFTTRMFQ